MFDFIGIFSTFQSAFAVRVQDVRTALQVFLMAIGLG